MPSPFFSSKKGHCESFKPNNMFNALDSSYKRTNSKQSPSDKSPPLRAENEFYSGFY